MFNCKAMMFFSVWMMAAAQANALSAMSTQTSIVANSIQADAQNCANGTTPGTIGYSINQALNIHTELASAHPNTESLFSFANNCFGAASQIFDLSFSIPSLASILSAAQAAVMQYAQKRVCTAIQQVSGMVTAPINQSLNRVNGPGYGLTNLNGLTNGLVTNSMSQIDPQLGASYHNNNSGTTYSVEANPFNSTQTNFSTGSNAAASGSSTNINNMSNQINSLNQQIANVQTLVGPAQYNVQDAQAQLASCRSHLSDCSSYESRAETAQYSLANLESQLSTLQGQLSSVSSSSNSQNGTSNAPVSSNSFVDDIYNLIQ